MVLTMDFLRLARAELISSTITAGCMSVGSREAVDEMSARLAAVGYRHVVGPRVTGDGCYEICILLDGGEELELTI